MRVLVTGGTGVLGRELVPRLTDRAEVRVMSRRPAGRPGHVHGDLDTGEGLAAAVADMEVIAHCASSADYRRPDRDVAGTGRLLQAMRDARRDPPHLVYISIVGVDRVPFGYYRAKLATEQLIAGSGVPWTTLRTTQFHDLALQFAMWSVVGPFALVPRGFRGQPVDTGEVADRLAELVLGEPAGRVPDLGGPRVESSAQGMRTYLAAAGLRRLVLRLPVPPLGRTVRAFTSGGHLLDHTGVRGRRTFEDFVRSRVGPDGTIEPPYRHWRRR